MAYRDVTSIKITAVYPFTALLCQMGHKKSIKQQKQHLTDEVEISIR